MKTIKIQFPLPVADGERVELHYSNRDLILRFVDWRERPAEHRFVETLAFRWQAKASASVPRNDEVYEVLGSPWLAQELQDEGLNDADAFAHYILCFNAEKVLELVCRRTFPADC
jgi:hypothetical protein